MLDTWFSSALWPMSTLGWPQKTAELETWNPTHTLCTAGEIITLWVSRMVMFNLYFLDRLPFCDVLHPRDDPGRRGPEDDQVAGQRRGPAGHHPLARRRRHALHAGDDGDHHAGRSHAGRAVCPHCQTENDPASIVEGGDKNWDGVRNCKSCGKPFTVPGASRRGTREAPLARNTSPKFDIGRQFCNKLANAAKFVFAALDKQRAGIPPSAAAPAPQSERDRTSAKRIPPGAAGTGPQPPEAIDETKWSMADRWIVSRFQPRRRTGQQIAALVSF